MIFGTRQFREKHQRDLDAVSDRCECADFFDRGPCGPLFRTNLASAGFDAHPHTRPSFSSTRSGTLGTATIAVSFAATLSRISPLGVCHQTRPAAARMRRCWATVI